MSIQMEWSPDFQWEFAVLNKSQELMNQGILALVKGQRELFDAAKYDKVFLDLRPYFGKNETLEIERAIETKKIKKYARNFFKENNLNILAQHLKKEPLLCLRIAILAKGSSKILDQMEESVKELIKNLTKKLTEHNLGAINVYVAHRPINWCALFAPLGIVSSAFVVNTFVVLGCMIGERVCDEDSPFHEEVMKNEKCTSNRCDTLAGQTGCRDVTYDCKKLYCRNPETGEEIRASRDPFTCFDPSLLSLQVMTGLCLFSCLLPFFVKALSEIGNHELYLRGRTYFRRREHFIKAVETENILESHKRLLDQILQHKNEQEAFLKEGLIFS